MQRCSSRRAFTLIEMLVVVAVMGILMGLVFRMMVIAKNHAIKGTTVGILERVQHALEEYRAEYGRYPPVRAVEEGPEDTDGKKEIWQIVRYEYEDVERQPGSMRHTYLHSDDGSEDEDTIIFRFGLCSYLYPRARGGAIEHTNHNQWIGSDSQRDLDAKARWAPFVEGLHHWWFRAYEWTGLGGGGTPYSNQYITIWDGWRREICYESHPPYLTYRLWSKGPDGATRLDSEHPSTRDDIHRDKWDNY